MLRRVQKCNWEKTHAITKTQNRRQLNNWWKQQQINGMPMPNTRTHMHSHSYICICMHAHLKKHNCVCVSVVVYLRQAAVTLTPTVQSQHLLLHYAIVLFGTALKKKWSTYIDRLWGINRFKSGITAYIGLIILYSFNSCYKWAPKFYKYTWLTRWYWIRSYMYIYILSALIFVNNS